MICGPLQAKGEKHDVVTQISSLTRAPRLAQILRSLTAFSGLDWQARLVPASSPIYANLIAGVAGLLGNVYEVLHPSAIDTSDQVQYSAKVYVFLIKHVAERS